jgi:hypothetical protein
MTRSISRRTVLRTLAWAPAGCVALRAAAAAADAAPVNRLGVADPAALAVGYVEDASRVDRRQNPGFVPGNDCNSCVQLQGQKGDYGPCALFPGKVVNVHGWCKAWAPQI